MQKFYKFIILPCLLLWSISQTYAQVVRVTNGQNLQTLITNATAGTTFIVEAGSYGDLNITKRVAIIGPGYFLGSNQQATTGSAVFGTINFKAGSENSVLMSCAVSTAINIGASSVTVSRCFAGYIYVGNDGSTNITSLTNITIKQSYCNYIVQLNTSLLNCLVQNNIVRYYIQFEYTFSGDIKNNTSWGSGDSLYGIYIYSPNNTSYVNIKNNILYSFYNYYPTNMYAVYNVFYANQTGLPTSNKVNIAQSSIFVGANTASLDAQYMLSATSPAKGAGENGVDCGAFGGDEPYVIGGVPGGPVVYQLTVPQTINSGATLNVTVKARVQN